MSCSVKFVRNLTSSEVYHSLESKYGQDIAMRLFVKFQSSGYERFGEFLHNYIKKYGQRKMERIVRDSFDKTLDDTASRAGGYVLFTAPRLITKGKGKGKYSSYIYSGEQLIKMKNHLIKSAEANQEIEDELQDLEEIPLEYNDYEDNANFMLSVDSQYQFVLDNKKEELYKIEEAIAKAKSSNDSDALEKWNTLKLEAEENIAKLSEKPNFSDVMSISDKDIEDIEKILNKEKVSPQDLQFVINKTNFWLSNKFEEAFFDREDNKESPNYKIFQEKKNKFDSLSSKIQNIAVSYMKDILEDTTDKKYTNDEVYELITKLEERSGIGSLTRGLSTDKNIFTQAIDKKIFKETNEFARQEHLEFMKELKAQTEKLIKALGTSDPKVLYKSMIQLDSKGNPTGQIVDRFSQAFYEARKKSRVTDWSNKHQVEKRFKFLKENTISFDYRILFNEEYQELEKDNKPYIFDEEDKEKHIQELKKNMGEKNFNFFYEKAEKAFELYKERLSEVENNIELSGLSEDDKKAELKKWKEQYSPFFFMEKTTGNNYAPGRFLGYDYIVNVPRKYALSTGKETEWYDKNFEKVQSNDALLEYYNFFRDKLKEFRNYYPSDDDLQSNYLPELRKSVMLEQFMSNPLGLHKQAFDYFLNEVSENDIFQNQLDSIGNLKRTLPIYMMSNNMSKLTQAEKEIIKDKAKLKIPNTDSIEFTNLVEKMEYDAIQKKLKEKSFDLYAILAANATSAYSYKHKARVEDLLKISKFFIDKASKIHVDNSGNTKKNYFGVLAQKEGLKNLTASFNYTYDVFYGLGKNKTEGKKIAKDSESAKQIKIYNDEIEQLKKEPQTDETVKKIKLTEQKIASLQKTFVSANAVDLALKYLHVKSLGWNPFSAVTNLGFGFISNYTHAAGGEDYDETELTKAYGLLLNNVFKVGDYQSKTALKISQLMMEYGVVGDIREGTGSYKESNISKKLEILLPYQMTMRAEFLNQGSTFIAMMLRTKIKNLKGENKSLFEAYKLDDKGNLIWNSEEFGENKEWESLGKAKINFKLKVEAVKKIVHGNYDINDPVLAKKHAFGRALIMFRSWMAEGFAQRFQSQRTDINLGRTVKGRYRSYYDAKTKEGEEIGILGALTTTLKEMGRILTKGLYNSEGINNLTDVDKANLQKNAMEINFYLMLISLSLLLKGLSDDDDETLMVTNFMINNFNRLQSDVDFYSNPLSFEKLQRNTIPAFTFITDIAKLSKASIRYIEGKDGDNNATTLNEAFFRVFPGGFAYYRTEALLDKVQ